MVTKIDHLAFRVSDIDKTYDLLKQLGYVVVRRTDHHGGALEVESPEQPGLVLEFTMLRQEKNEVPGFDHACFSLKDEAELQGLVEAGFPVTGKLHLVPGSGRMTESWKDNDGTKWQFVLN